jgi:hypothetical protein
MNTTTQATTAPMVSCAFSQRPKSQPHATGTLAAAQSLARQGFYVFPLRTGSKKPAHEGWQDEATNDPEQIKKLWGTRPFNVGIYTGKFGDGQALIAVDVDVKNNKDGRATMRELQEQGKDFPPTMQAETPTGGEHWIYVTGEAVKQGVDTLGSGLDIRSSGGYIAGIGSTVEAGTYKLAVDKPAAPSAAPAWLIEACGAPRAKAVDRTPLAGVDPERARARGIAYLATAERSVKGAGGDQCAYRVATKLMSLGNDPAATLDLMLSEHWDEGCGWAPDRLQEKVAHAERYMQDPIGTDAPEAQFEAVELAPVDDAPVPAWVAEMNDRYFVVNESGKPRVMRQVFDAVFGRRHFERSTFDDMKKLYLNRQVPGKAANLATAWLGHPKRRDYLGGLVFAPGKAVDADQYNLWQGFGVEPALGDWSLLRNHTHEQICQGNEFVFEYLMNWMARAVQEPSKQGETAVVMRSGEGTGKGVLARAMVKLFGQHGMQVMHSKHVAGNFNAHMRDLCFLFADEAFYAGDRSQEGVLKGLITEPTIPIELKGMDVVSVPNMLHIMLASNADWVVPAGKDDRRYLVLEVAETFKNKAAYFAPLYEQLENGGYAAMLHELLSRDILNFDVRHPPSTKAHIAQKRMTLRGVDAWVDDLLERGSVGAAMWTPDGLEVPTHEVYDAYLRFHDRSRAYRCEQIGQWSQSLTKLLGDAQVSRTRPRVGTSRPKCLKFASLARCRAAFEKSLGGSVSWAEETSEMAEPESPARDVFS